MAKVFVVEDHAFMREMLREYINQEEDLEVCETAESGEVALERLEQITPDLVLIDLSLTGITGLDLISRLKERHPGLQCAILSGHGERRYVDQALAAGAQGYILKGDPDELPGAIRQMIQGQRYISNTL
ncbi:response regulator [Billgrantia endophytica]|uniref:DNA-binding response regulator n=1 Tax=Billgrantia endophytica TaxID=2033802 RepID=A0A2N7TWY7_9GAMM|nr:response regulator transcription factor [Halomonas endophytica]PMR72681.1 DNA-binding response regulator [Halomonas endophytica]